MVNVCYDVSNLRFFNDIITYFDLCFKKGPGCPFLTILNDRVVYHFSSVLIYSIFWLIIDILDSRF